MDTASALRLPESDCPQAACLRESFDAAGLALDCRHGDADATEDAAEDARP